MRIALGLEYHGAPFHGWQSQADGSGVQDALERAVSAIAGAPVRTIAAGRTDYANLEAAGRMELARRGWKVDYVAVRHGLALRIPHPEGYDHPNLLIVLAAAMIGTTRLIDNVDVIKKDGED